MSEGAQGPEELCEGRQGTPARTSFPGKTVGALWEAPLLGSCFFACIGVGGRVLAAAPPLVLTLDFHLGRDWLGPWLKEPMRALGSAGAGHEGAWVPFLALLH